MVTRPTPRRNILMTAIAYHNDGSESKTTWTSPMDEAACERVVGTLIACLFETPVDKGSAPSRFVSVSTPLTKVECSFEIVEDTKSVPTPRQLADAKLPFRYD